MGYSFRTRTGFLIDELGPALLADIRITGFTWHFGLLLHLMVVDQRSTLPVGAAQSDV